MGGGPASIDTTNNTLVVWILSEHKGNQWPNYQVMAYDKAATACVGNWGGGNSRQIKIGMYVMGVQLDAFPRRDSKIYLHIMSWGSVGSKPPKASSSSPIQSAGKILKNGRRSRCRTRSPTATWT